MEQRVPSQGKTEEKSNGRWVELADTSVLSVIDREEMLLAPASWRQETPTDSLHGLQYSFGVSRKVALMDSFGLAVKDVVGLNGW